MKFKIKYYKNPPSDMTILEKIEDTTETKEELLGHYHVIEAIPIEDMKIPIEAEVIQEPKTEVVPEDVKPVKRGRKVKQ